MQAPVVAPVDLEVTVVSAGQLGDQHLEPGSIVSLPADTFGGQALIRP
jgi:hypothetical protein